MIDTGDIGVFCGLDVGKGEHHATALTPAGKKVHDKRQTLKERTADREAQQAMRRARH
jgi:tmRNA-binding protein